MIRTNHSFVAAPTHAPFPNVLRRPFGREGPANPARNDAVEVASLAGEHGSSWPSAARVRSGSAKVASAVATSKATLTAAISRKPAPTADGRRSGFSGFAAGFAFSAGLFGHGFLATRARWSRNAAFSGSAALRPTTRGGAA